MIIEWTRGRILSVALCLRAVPPSTHATSSGRLLAVFPYLCCTHYAMGEFSLVLSSFCVLGISAPSSDFWDKVFFVNLFSWFLASMIVTISFCKTFLLFRLFSSSLGRFCSIYCHIQWYRIGSWRSLVLIITPQVNWDNHMSGCLCVGNNS